MAQVVLQMLPHRALPHQMPPMVGRIHGHKQIFLMAIDRKSKYLGAASYDNRFNFFVIFCALLLRIEFWGMASARKILSDLEVDSPWKFALAKCQNEMGSAIQKLSYDRNRK